MGLIIFIAFTLFVLGLVIAIRKSGAGPGSGSNFPDSNTSTWSVNSEATNTSDNTSSSDCSSSSDSSSDSSSCSNDSGGSDSGGSGD